MRRRQTSWWSRIGTIVLTGGLLLGEFGVASAASPTSEEILAKLNELLTAVGAIKEGNHTVRWDQKLPAATRFVVLTDWNSEAVLDRETGLVWEQSPATTLHEWGDARIQVCVKRTTGNRKGWRLPSVHELASLIDPLVASPGPTIPPGQSFTNVQREAYWSATTSADAPTLAWDVHFSDGLVRTDSKTGAAYVWCVRGGNNADQY